MDWGFELRVCRSPASFLDGLPTTEASFPPKAPETTSTIGWASWPLSLLLSRFRERTSGGHQWARRGSPCLWARALSDWWPGYGPRAVRAREAVVMGGVYGMINDWHQRGLWAEHICGPRCSTSEAENTRFFIFVDTNVHVLLLDNYCLQCNHIFVQACTDLYWQWKCNNMDV